MRNFNPEQKYTCDDVLRIFNIDPADVTEDALQRAKESLIRQGYVPNTVNIDGRGGGSMRQTWFKGNKTLVAKLPRPRSNWLPLSGTNAVNGAEYLTYLAASKDEKELMLGATLDRIGSILVVKMEAISPVNPYTLDYHLIHRLEKISLDGLQVGMDRYGNIKWYDYAPPLHTGRACRCKPGW